MVTTSIYSMNFGKNFLKYFSGIKSWLGVVTNNFTFVLILHRRTSTLYSIAIDRVEYENYYWIFSFFKLQRFFWERAFQFFLILYSVTEGNVWLVYNNIFLKLFTSMFLWVCAIVEIVLLYCNSCKFL